MGRHDDFAGDVFTLILAVFVPYLWLDWRKYGYALDGDRLCKERLVAGKADHRTSGKGADG